MAITKVTTEVITGSAVTTPKIADNAITAAKIPDGTIATGHIADNAVTAAKIPDNVLTATMLPDNVILATHIPNATNLTLGTVTANLTGNASGTAATVTTAAQPAITSLGTLTGLTVNGAAVFNEDSADFDFRVESNGNANMLFVDGGTDNVGIGTTPADAGSTTRLHIADAASTAILQLTGAGVGTAATDGFHLAADDNGDAYLRNYENGTMYFYTNAAAQMKLTDGALLPSADNDLDLGSASLEFKNLYIDGTAYLDNIDLKYMESQDDIYMSSADGNNNIYFRNGSDVILTVKGSNNSMRTRFKKGAPGMPGANPWEWDVGDKDKEDLTWLIK